MAVSIGLPRGDQRRKWLVGQGAQMLFGPGEDILPRGAEARQVANVQAAWHMPARGPAQLTPAYGAAKTILFPHQRQVSRDFHGNGSGICQACRFFGSCGGKMDGVPARVKIDTWTAS